MMKILLTTDRYYPAISGVITSVMNLEKELTKRGHEVKILTLSENMTTHTVGNIIYIGSFNASMIYPDVRLKHPILKKTLKMLIDWHPDIIHSNCEFSTYFMAKRISYACKIPMVHTYHTDYEDYVHYVAMSKEFGTQVVKKYVNYVTKHMTRIICPTVKTQKLLEGYGVNRPLDIIPTGLDLDRFKPEISEEKRNELYAHYRLDKNKRIILFIGRLGKEKNINELITYLSKIERKDYQFLIVGDGPDKIDIQKDIMHSGLISNTIFTGMIPQQDVALFYKLGSLFISASQSETQGLTFIEALSSGVPLLCKKDPCLDNVIIQGQNGYQFLEEEDFTRHFNEFLDMSEEEMAKLRVKTKEDALSKFGSSVFCDNILECYDKALKNPIKINCFKAFYNRLLRALPFV